MKQLLFCYSFLHFVPKNKGNLRLYKMFKLSASHMTIIPYISKLNLPLSIYLL